MNTAEIIKKRLVAFTAMCGAAFLFAACEPQDDRPAEGEHDTGAPTYGEPDRPADPAYDDPAAAPQQDQQMEQQDQQQTDDQWENDTQN